MESQQQSLTWDLDNPTDVSLLLGPIRSQIVAQRKNANSASLLIEKLNSNPYKIIQLTSRTGVLQILETAYIVKVPGKWSIQSEQSYKILAEFTKNIMGVLDKGITQVSIPEVISEGANTQEQIASKDSANQNQFALAA